MSQQKENYPTEQEMHEAIDRAPAVYSTASPVDDLDQDIVRSTYRRMGTDYLAEEVRAKNGDVISLDRDIAPSKPKTSAAIYRTYPPSKRYPKGHTIRVYTEHEDEPSTKRKHLFAKKGSGNGEIYIYRDKPNEDGYGGDYDVPIGRARISYNPALSRAIIKATAEKLSSENKTKKAA